MPRLKQKWQSKEPEDFEIQTSIPLYTSCWLTLNVSDDIDAEHKKHPEFELEEHRDGAATFSNEKGQFGIFFTHDYLRKGVIAHEIFHVTHRIMAYIEQDFDIDSHEAHAYLCDWITDWTYGELETRNEKIQPLKRKKEK